LPLGTTCGGATIADVNHDGINDAVISDDSGTGYVYVYFGHPTQAELTANTYPNAPPTVWPSSVSQSDLTGGTAKGGGNYGFVQQNASTGHVGSSNAVSFTTNTTAGNLIMVALDYPSTATLSSVTDSQGNSFTQAGSTLTSHLSQKTAVYYAPNIKGGADTVTLTFTGGTTSDIYVTEYSGLATSSPVDVQKSHTHTGSGAATSNSATTTVPGDIIYAFCFVDSGAGCTAGSGFTGHTTGNLVEDETSGAAGSYAATATAGSNYTMQMVALKPASGMAPSYGFTIQGTGNVGWGYGIVTTADVNGDGIPDLLFDRVAERHCCLSAPQELYVRVSPHTAQVFTSARCGGPGNAPATSVSRSALLCAVSQAKRRATNRSRSLSE